MCVSVYVLYYFLRDTHKIADFKSMNFLKDIWYIQYVAIFKITIHAKRDFTKNVKQPGLVAL